MTGFGAAALSGLPLLLLGLALATLPQTLSPRVVRLHLVFQDEAPAAEPLLRRDELDARMRPPALPLRPLRLALPSLTLPRGPEASQTLGRTAQTPGHADDFGVLVEDASEDVSFLRLRLALQADWGALEPSVGAEVTLPGEPVTVLDHAAVRATSAMIGPWAGLRLLF